LLGISARTLSLNHGFSAKDTLIQFVSRYLTLEKGICLGTLTFVVGFLTDSWIAYQWAKNGFGELQQVRAALFALLLMVIGTQTVFSSFFLSLFGIPTDKTNT